MPNPKPRTEFLKPYKPVGEMPGEPLGNKPIAVRVGVSTQDAIFGLSRSERVTWLRRVLTEAAQRELMNVDGTATE